MHKRGFTLIELLIVIAIIGILATVVIMNVSGARDKAIAAKTQSDLTTVYKATSLYRAIGNDFRNLEEIGAFNRLEDDDIKQFVDESGNPFIAVAPTTNSRTENNRPYGWFYGGGADVLFLWGPLDRLWEGASDGLNVYQCGYDPNGEYFSGSSINGCGISLW